MGYRKDGKVGKARSCEPGITLRSLLLILNAAGDFGRTRMSVGSKNLNWPWWGNLGSRKDIEGNSTAHVCIQTQGCEPEQGAHPALNTQDRSRCEDRKERDPG